MVLLVVFVDAILQFTRPDEKRVFDIARDVQLALAGNELFKKASGFVLQTIGTGKLSK
jgi:hypothetical protein